jgi:hypothetical protein
MLEVTPSGFGHDQLRRIEALEEALKTIEREISGMRKEIIYTNDGTLYEVIGKYSGTYEETNKLPFQIDLIDKGGYFVATVARGHIVQRITKENYGSNQTVYILPENVLNLFGTSIEHGVGGGQAIFVKYNTDNKGIVKSDPAPTIVVQEDTTSSANYFPEVGDWYGQEGEYFYKLANFIATPGDGLIARIFHAGDHIHHYAERVTMKNPANESSADYYNVLKDYEPTEDVVNFKALEQLNTDGIPIISPTSSDSTIPFRRIKGAYVDAQVRVSADGDAILVQGNGVNGSLSWVDCTGYSTTILQWQDGLITSESDSFTAGCQSDLPSELPE